MFVKYRPTRLADLEECLGCIRDGFSYDERESAELLAFWRHLLTTGAAMSAVMEDQVAPAGNRIAWFCLNVFLRPEYACYLKTGALPFVARQVLRAWQRGASPFLSRSEIRGANVREGVTILVLNAGAPARLGRLECRREVVDQLADFSTYLIAGYRCNEILFEFYDDFSCTWAEGAGLRMRTDYEGRICAGDLPDREASVAASVHPRLFGAIAEEASMRAGTLASMLFSYREPRFYFRPLEQELLNEALRGETDEDLARSLGVALVTVRKRWDTIYDRVAEIDRTILCPAEWPLPASHAPEKKRRLLCYLRQHLEELRPLDPPRVPVRRRTRNEEPRALLVGCA